MKGIKMKPIASTRQQGQTFLWILATLAACCALLMIVFNVGQVATEKAKTTNAADAVAMSGGLVQARGMNLMAYTNRAIIADEMTIATLASLDSWVKYNAQLATTLSYIPYVDYIAQPIADVMTQISDGIAQVLPSVIQGIQLVITALELQNDALKGAIPVAVKEASEQVAAQNNVDMNNAAYFSDLSFAKNLADNLTFFDYHSKNGSNGDDRQVANDIMMNSRDLWNAKRGAGTAIDALNFGAAFSIISPQIDKTSGSARLRDFDHWEVQDSLDLFVDICVPVLGCAGVPVAPLGWGRANVNSDGSQGNDWAGLFNSWCDYFPFAPACALAYENYDTFSTWNGVPDMWDVNKNNRKKDIKYFVSVKSKNGNPPLTSQQLGFGTIDVNGPQGSPRVTDNLAPSQAIGSDGKPELQAISAARVFFKRPTRDKAHDPTSADLWRADGVEEYGSLYNPYWQARLHTPNCRLTDPASDDCLARGILYSGNIALEGAIDLVSP